MIPFDLEEYDERTERLIDRADRLRAERKDREMEEREAAREKARAAYRSLGQNPASVPDGRWVRVSVSGTGNRELWVEDCLQLQYEILCD